MPLSRDAGALLLRDAERQIDAGLSRPPPRLTRDDPAAAPDGSEPPASEPAYQSRHHSHTFPCVS